MRRVMWILALGCLISQPAQGQILTTVAGTGIRVFCGDGGTASDACLSFPSAVTLDPAGNLLIADSLHNRIRKVDLLGTITTVAGQDGWCGAEFGDGGPATRACLAAPRGVVADQDGSLFIADTEHNRVRKVDTTGTITTVAGKSYFDTGYGQYCGDNGPATRACLYRPGALTIGRFGSLLIADGGNRRVRQVDVTGTITTIAGNGSWAFCGDNGPATSACLVPGSLVLDGDGNVLIADVQNSRIRRIDAGGVITTVVGTGTADYCGDGGPAIAACLNGPLGVAIAPDGVLFISDSRNHRIRRVDADGMITTVAGRNLSGFCGDGPATRACLAYPAGVALDEHGALLIAELANNRVRKLETTPPILHLPTTPVAGCLEVTAKVELVGPAPQGGRVVTLASDNTNVTVPTTVTVAPGTRVQRYSILTTSVAAVETATITAAALGVTSAGAVLTIRPVAPASVTFSASPVVGGTTMEATVTLECPAGPGSVSVTLSSTRPDIADVVSPVAIVPFGAQTASFELMTVPVGASRTVKVRATANGVTKSRILTVNPGS